MKRTLVSLAALIGAAGLALPAQASTITIYGSLGNFDVYSNNPDDPNIPNNPGDSPGSGSGMGGGEYEHGFEIEFEDRDSSDLLSYYPT
jgi:hypothetical protein